MKTVNKHTLQMIAKFLEQNYADFQFFLDLEGIESSEAEVIIMDMQNFGKIGAARPVIDRKFLINAINPINGKQYDSSSAILLCAKDKATPVALHAYQAECMRLGSNQEHIESMGYLIDRVLDFQSEVECRVPDTVGDEIPRCLYGDGIN